MSGRNGILLVVIFLNFFGISSISAQPIPGYPPLVLERANSLKNKTQGEESIKELIGSVRITRGDMSVDCDYAVHYQKSGKVVFEKNVYYADSLREMWAQKVTYYIEQDSVKAEGKVKIEQKYYQGYCNIAYYTDRRQNVEMHKNVELRQRERNVTLTGSRGYGSNNMEYAKTWGNAQIVKLDSTGKTEIIIDAQTIEYFHKEARALASDSVKITRDDIKGFCDTLHYNTEAKYALMLVKPVVYHIDEEMRGDSIYMYIKDQTIDHLELYGNTSAISPAENAKEGEMNKMFGKKMLIYVKDDKIDNIIVTGNARSFYYLYEKDEFKGVNKASGDIIDLKFLDGKIDAIQIAGGTEGTYYPPEFAGSVEE